MTNDGPNSVLESIWRGGSYKHVFLMHGSNQRWQVVTKTSLYSYWYPLVVWTFYYSINVLHGWMNPVIITNQTWSDWKCGSTSLASQTFTVLSRYTHKMFSWGNWKCTYILGILCGTRPPQLIAGIPYSSTPVYCQDTPSVLWTRLWLMVGYTSSGVLLVAASVLDISCGGIAHLFDLAHSTLLPKF